MAGLSPRVTHADDTFGIMDRNPALGPFHENDYAHSHKHQGEDKNHDRWGHGSGLNQTDGVDDGRRHSSDNTGEYNQGNTVADTAFRNLLPHPHQKGGTSRQGYHGHQNKADARIGDDGFSSRTNHRLQPRRNSGTLDYRQDNRTVTCIFSDFLAALLAFLGQLLDRLKDHCQQLQDNRGTDIGHDAQCKNGHLLQGAAGKSTDQANQSPFSPFKKLGQHLGINPGCRYVTPNPIDRKHAQGKQNSTAQFRDGHYILQRRHKL